MLRLFNDAVPTTHFLRLPTARAIAQVAINRLLIVADRLQFQVRSCGICGVSRADCLPVFRFPLPIFIPPFALFL